LPSTTLKEISSWDKGNGTSAIALIVDIFGFAPEVVRKFTESGLPAFASQIPEATLFHCRGWAVEGEAKPRRSNRAMGMKCIEYGYRVKGAKKN
jgi:hypothetical protein